MKHRRIFFSILVIIGTTIGCQPATDTVSIESLLKEMVDRDAISTYPTHNFRLKQQSSYNRASVTPDEPGGWFTNKDFNSSDKDSNFVRVEEINGEKEWVLMDHKGAGAIVRSWMPFLNPRTPDTDITLKIYLDGALEPVIEGNMLDLFNGDGLIPFPFAHKSLRSSVSFFPIPYAKSCKITSTARPFFFQFTYREYPEGTSIKSFTMEDFVASSILTKEVGKQLLDPQIRKKGEQITMSALLNKGEEKTVHLPSGEAAIRSLTFKLGNYDNADITRTVILKMSFDGKETVWCPVGDFFGTGIGLNPYQGWHTTVEENGMMSCRWVMPYQNSGSITVLNLGETFIEFDLNANVDAYQWSDKSMYFHGEWKGQYPLPTRPFSDWNYITLKGKGVYAGDALTIMNPVKKWWGEGDERIWVDNDTFPSIFGTGTEDYYAYSWGGVSTDFYEHPFHAQPRSNVYNKLNRKTSDERDTQGYSTEIRTRALDGIPFESSLQLDMEVWSGTDCDMGYGVGLFWYGAATTTSNRKPDPVEALNIPPLPDGFPGIEN